MADPTSQLPKTSAFLLEWEWDAVRYRAASQVADGLLKDREISAIAGISDRQLRTWKKHPPFAALVSGVNGTVADAFKEDVVASKAGRLRILIDTHNKLLAIIEARALQHWEEREWAAGESTGLIVTKVTVGMSTSKEASLDTGLIKAMLDVQERIARELGQLDTSINVKHSGCVDHVHRVSQHNALTDQELEQLERIALSAQSREHEVPV
ncbi:MAG: hypothetical protein ACR2OU_09460 [Thermomicrobiales bacterium]